MSCKEVGYIRNREGKHSYLTHSPTSIPEESVHAVNESYIINVEVYIRIGENAAIIVYHMSLVLVCE